MTPFVFTLLVDTISADQLCCTVRQKSLTNRLRYSLSDGAVAFEQENALGQGIQENRHQLQKILRSAIDGKLYPGQRISCVFLEDFFFLKNVHFSQYIRLDQRQSKLVVSVSDSGLQGTYKLYADGSSNHETRQSGFGGFIETPDGTREVFSCSMPGRSSNLMELMALIEGLLRLENMQCVQIYTDSRYVIRGLVQWVHFWRHNNWQTAYGREVRYADHWQQAMAICQGKCIEFKWIKGHSGNADHDFCHQLAKTAAINGHIQERHRRE